MNEKIFCLATPEARVYYKAVPIAKEFLDKDQNIINTTGQIPDGPVAEFSVPSITTKHFKQGKLHGKLEIINLADQSVTFSEEYENGQLVRVTEPDISLPSHLPTEEKSAPVYKGTLLKTSNTGRAFYVNGKQIAEETISSNGATLELLGEIPDGEVKEFTETGKLKTQATYKNNKLNGVLTRYNDEEKIFSKETYEDGILKGPAEYFSYSGEKVFHTRCNYKNSVLDGEFILEEQDGPVREKSFYQNGKRHGVRTTFYPNTSQECTENWNEGKLQGERTLFFPTGPMWYKENYINGRLDGERTEFFPSGQARLTEFYSEGLLDGKRCLYDEQGNVLTSDEFHWGNIVQNTEFHSL